MIKGIFHIPVSACTRLLARSSVVLLDWLHLSFQSSRPGYISLPSSECMTPCNKEEEGEEERAIRFAESGIRPPKGEPTREASSSSSFNSFPLALLFPRPAGFPLRRPAETVGLRARGPPRALRALLSLSWDVSWMWRKGRRRLSLQLSANLFVVCTVVVGVLI